MHYKVVLPSETLEPFVECFWLLSAPNAEGEAETQIVLPDGKTELIIHFGSHFLKLEGTSENAYKAIHAWMAKNGKKEAGAPWEVYLTDPSSTQESESKMQIFFPIR